MYEFIAGEIVSRLAPWLWQNFHPAARSQTLLFTSPREVTQWQFHELIIDIEAAVTYANERLSDDRNGMFREKRDYFTYEIDAVTECVSGLDEFLKLERYRRDLDSEVDLDRLRQLLNSLLREIRLPGGIQLDMTSSKYRAKLKPSFLEQRAKNSRGELISKETDERSWLVQRKSGLTSSDAGRLIRLNGERRAGWRELFRTKLPEYVSEYFDTFTLGIEREPKIAEWVLSNFPEEGFFHNEFIYLSQEDKRLMSTPDLVGDFAVCEIKVSSADLKTNLQRYQDQIQWHMMVLGAPLCLFVVENRYDQSKSFEWVVANEHRASALREAADLWLQEFDNWREQDARF